MTVADFTDSYDRDGYCFPVDVLGCLRSMT